MKDVVDSFKQLIHVLGEKIYEIEIKEVLDKMCFVPNLRITKD